MSQKCVYDITLNVPSHPISFEEFNFIMNREHGAFEVKNYFTSLHDNEKDEVKKEDYRILAILAKEASQNSGEIVKLQNSKCNLFDEGNGKATERPAVEVTARFQTFEDLVMYHDSIKRELPFSFR